MDLLNKVMHIAGIFLVPAICWASSAQEDDIDSIPASDRNLRVLYWNIQNGMWSGQQSDYKEFVAFVARYQPDVCVWAEAQSNYLTASSEGYADDSDRYFPGAWADFARRYGHGYCYKGGHRDRFPQVVTSRYPIENVKRIVGAEPDSIVSHGAGWARIVVGNDTVNIVTVHTWPQKYGFGVDKPRQKEDAAVNGGDRYRRKEIEYICRNTIESVPGADRQLWMMMGDFNSLSRLDNRFYGMPADTSAFLCHDYVLEHTPYIDVVSKKYPSELVPTIWRDARIDYVYCTPALYNCIADVKVIRDDYTTPVRDSLVSRFFHPSDHCPILIDFNKP